jgi:DNA-directed RNA polymerase subunit RPC12/RpoP
MQEKKTPNANGVITLDDYQQMSEDNEGQCTSCGYRQCAEPDAENYECEECGKRLVFGADWFLITGRVR